jgi:3-methyladenine DNA glycosylase AlkD
MAAAKVVKRGAKGAAVPAKSRVLKTEVAAALAWLRRQGTRRNIEGMARYGIVASRAFGVSMGTMSPLAKRLGKDQELSLALWASGWFEARMLAAMIGVPAMVTKRQMNAWAADFETWADCDTVCLKLFCRAPDRWAMVPKWSAARREFVKRAAFSLIAGLAHHDPTATDAQFLALLPLIERAATDERPLVRKGVSWALRGVGRRNVRLHKAALNVARRLAASDNPAPRWVGRDAIRELASDRVIQGFASALEQG